MPFYNTRDQKTFPQTPPRPKNPSRRAAYLHMTKDELIALCDERGILSKKGTRIGRYQKKGYYIERLVDYDHTHPAPQPEESDS